MVEVLFLVFGETTVLNSYIMYKNMPRPPQTPEPMTHFQFHLQDLNYLEIQPGTDLLQKSKTLQALQQCVQCRGKDVRTASKKRPETVFGCYLCNTHLCDEHCFTQFHSQLNKDEIKRETKKA